MERVYLSCNKLFIFSIVHTADSCNEFRVSIKNFFEWSFADFHRRYSTPNDHRNKLFIVITFCCACIINRGYPNKYPNFDNLCPTTSLISSTSRRGEYRPTGAPYFLYHSSLNLFCTHLNTYFSDRL